MVELVLSLDEKMDLHKFAALCKYCKISPVAYIFSKALLEGLMDELIFGLAYQEGKFAFQKSIGLAL